MAILPRTFFGRCLAIVWLGGCIAILAFAFSAREINDMPIAATWLMLFLTAPAGIIVSGVFTLLVPYMQAQAAYIYDPFWEFVPFWIGCVILGYFQWFVALPLLWKRLIRGKAT
jgi:hypothetical protein